MLASLQSEAQQRTKLPQLGFVTGNRDAVTIEYFQSALRDLGLIEGKNILIEYRFMDGKQDRVEGFVAELIRSKVDVLISPLPQAVIAGKNLTKKIPIVMMITGRSSCHRHRR